jgi:hypothetical protein
MRPRDGARILVALLALLIAWGAVVLSAGAALAHTTPAPAPTAPPHPPAITVSPGAPAGPAPAQPAPANPGNGSAPPQEENGLCDRGPVLTRVTCQTIGDVAGNLAKGDVAAIPGDVAVNVTGGAVGVMQESMASAITKWVVDGSTWLITQLGGLLDSSTAPQIDQDWFASHYRTMAAMAAVVALPLLLVSLIGALLHQDGGRLVRTVFGQLPLAGILTGAGIALVGLGLAATDAMTAWVTQGAGGNASEILGRSAAALTTVSGQDGGLFAAFIGGVLLAVSAVMVWFWLLLRSAAIYVAVLFLPLAVAGLVWPATSHWAKRLTHLLVAIILSKFVIASILSLATAGTGEGDGFGAVLAGVVLLALAALSPLGLMRLAPILEAGAASMAPGRRSSAASAAAAGGGGGALLRQANSWKAVGDAGPAPRGWGSATGGSASPAGALRTVASVGAGAVGLATRAGSAVTGSGSGSAPAPAPVKEAPSIPRIPEGTNGHRPSPTAGPDRPARRGAPEAPFQPSAI